jgi:class 3 adenylate cyclase/tetratricopeptide (TPR) repeat protein
VSEISSAPDARATEPATEIRTFLIADVRGYTRFTLDHGDEAAARLAARFAELAEGAVAARGGAVLELRGDEALAVFASARQALRAALEMQARFVAEGDSSLPLKVGIGLDAGEAIPVKGGYRGTALNLAARLCSLAGPGEVLASDTVANLARRIEGLEYADRGTAQLKGFAEPVRVVAVIPSEGASPALSPHPPTPSPMLGEGEKNSPEELPSPSMGEGLGVRGYRGGWGVRGQDLPIGGFLGALPEGVLVAREEELARLASAVDAVAGGAGRLVLLAGEPGVGKTRLAQEVTLNARNRGFLVATGRCYEPSQGIPFYPFLEALSNAYVASPPSVRAIVAERWPHLGRLLPDHMAPPSIPPSDSQEERERIFRAVTGFLLTLAEIGPVALLLDDLHWADDSSLALLQHLARHTRASPLLLLGTYRDVEVDPDHPLEAALLDLGRERLIERIAVRRLADSGTAAMMAATLGTADLSPELAHLIHSRTEGNAFFVEEVVRSLVERGDIYRLGHTWALRDIDDIEVPESVRSVIGRRMGRLHEPTQETLLAASVLGQTFAFDDLQAIEERSEEDVETALEEAVASGLIRETGRDNYAFNHALTQQALYSRLSSRRRRRLHLAAGEALQRLPERERDRRPASRPPHGPKVGVQAAAELAWHFLEGDDPEQALRYSLLAGDQAEDVFAHAEAERHYRAALDLARELGDKAAEAEALGRLGTVLNALARYDEAIAALEGAAELARQGGHLAGEVWATIELGSVHRAAGTAAQGIARVQALLDRLDEKDRPADVASMSIVLETLFFATGRYLDGLAGAERASRLAESIGDQVLRARAEVSRGTELGMIGHWLEGVRVLEAAIPLCESADLWYDASRALVNASNAYFWAGQFEEARLALVRSLAIQERVQNANGMAFTLCNLGAVYTLLGEWPEAHAYLRRGLDLRETARTAWWAAYPLLEFGRLLADEGRWKEADAAFREALESAVRNGDLQATRYGSMLLARLEIEQGDPVSARRRLEPLLDRPGLEESEVTDMLPNLAWAHLESGDAARAAEIIEESIRRAAPQEKGLDLAEALLVKGKIEAALGRRAEAIDAFGEAARLAAPMPYPHLEARALHELGLVESRAGNLEAAREHLKAALTIFRRLGAETYAERAENALPVD